MLTRSASPTLVAGVLAGVVAAVVGSSYQLQGRPMVLFPIGVVAGGAVGFAFCPLRYGQLEG